MMRPNGGGARWRRWGGVSGLALLLGLLFGPPSVLPAAAQDELYVANAGGDSITVYSRTADGNVTPLRTISGGLTGLSGPVGLALAVTAAIPTLSEWAQLGMLALLLGGGLLALRRRAVRA